MDVIVCNRIARLVIRERNREIPYVAPSRDRLRWRIVLHQPVHVGGIEKVFDERPRGMVRNERIVLPSTEGNLNNLRARD